MKPRREKHRKTQRQDDRARYSGAAWKETSLDSPAVCIWFQGNDSQVEQASEGIDDAPDAPTSPAPATREIYRRRRGKTMAGRDGRIERRNHLRVRVILEALSGNRRIEVAQTENVSSQGLRAVAANRWNMQDEILVSIHRTDLRRRARIVYCQPRHDGQFALGLSLSSPAINWAEVPHTALAS